MTHIFLYTNILTQTKKNFNSSNRKNETPEREIKKSASKEADFFILKNNLMQILQIRRRQIIKIINYLRPILFIRV